MTEKKVNLVICRGPNCSVNGAASLVAWADDLEKAGVPIHCSRSGCTDNCEEAPVVQWNGRYLTEVTTADLTGKLIEEDII